MAPVSSPPPPGNLDPAWAAQSNLARILGITGAFHFLALVSVVLRLYVRIGLLRTPGKDDVAIIAAYLCALGGYICFVLQGYHGLGRHTMTLSQTDLKDFERLIFVQGIVSAIGALGFLKISIAFFLLRLAKTGQKWYSRSLWAIIVFVCLYTIVAWLTFLLRCQPMAGFWDWSIQATCWSIHTFIKVAQVNTAFNIATDVFFAILPIPIVWRLHMSRQTRINIIIVLSLGYIAVALGIVKAVYQVALKKNTDRHFDQHIQFWGFLQLNVGIVAASIPTLKPLLKGGRSPSNANRNPRAGALAQVRESTVKTKPSRTGWSFLQRRPALPPGARSYDLSNPNQMMQQNAKQLYSTSDDERTNSEAEMVQVGGADAKAATCMTEVVVDSECQQQMNR